MKFFSGKYTELILGILILIAGLLFLLPVIPWMPDTLDYIIFIIFLILATLYILTSMLIFNADEREEIHALTAGQVGFHTGLVILLAALIYQLFTTQMVNIWLLLTLIAMVTTATITRYFLTRFK